MTKKQWYLIALAVVLGGVSVYLNSDWFAGEDIQIIHRSLARPMFGKGRRPNNSPVDPIVFGLNRKLKLTAIKVVALSDLETNKYPHALWNLVSESNSPPVKSFNYGAAVPGMHPAVKGIAPEPLQPDVGYRLFIEAGSKKAQHDFVPRPRSF